MKRKKIAVVLSGCGVFDGSEIHEATLTLLAIDKNKCDYQCFAPDILQHHVINHITGDQMNEQRNVLVESARIARGNIKSLVDFVPNNYDALIFPGGFGVAKNLSTLAFNGANCEVDATVKKVLIDAQSVGIPIGALCISPAVIAQVFKGAKVTIGSDVDTINVIEKSGGVHVESTYDEVVIDNVLKLVTTPCYMLDASISQIANGVDNLVHTLLKMVR